VWYGDNNIIFYASIQDNCYGMRINESIDGDVVKVA